MSIEQAKALVRELVADGILYASVAHNIDWARYEDEDGKPEAFACDVALQWYDDGLQCEISTGFCSINIPEDGRGYDPETIYMDGTDNGWEYWINVAGLSEEDEEELVSLMKDKFYQYNLTQAGCVVEHY